MYIRCRPSDSARRSALPGSERQEATPAGPLWITSVDHTFGTRPLQRCLVVGAARC